MAKIKVLVWSGTGNTAEMGNAVVEGIVSAGAEAEILGFSSVTASDLLADDRFALGCPAMGAEVLEESEVEPFMAELEAKGLSGKKIALFGSYGWGDGEWMRSWESRVTAAGGELVGSVMANNAPTDDAKDECRDLGRSLARA